jgi:hypothetical protein
MKVVFYHREIAGEEFIGAILVLCVLWYGILYAISVKHEQAEMSYRCLVRDNVSACKYIAERWPDRFREAKRLKELVGD